MTDKELFAFFAAHAATGMLANPNAMWVPSKEEKEAGVTAPDKVASKAFEVSAAMLRAYKRSV